MITKEDYYTMLEGILDHMVRFENDFPQYDNTRFHIFNIEDLNVIERKLVELER